MEIITSHINADFDSLASMTAARKLYPSARVVFPGSQERQVRDFIEVFQPFEITRQKDVDPSTVERLILVDTRQPGRLGPLAAILSNPGLKIHVYDHHPIEENDIRGEVEAIEEVGATATLFTEILRERRLDPDPMEATILALGIYEETGSLLFPSTTERDLLAAAYLLRRGANLNIVSSYLKTELSVEELDLLNELVKSSEEYVVNGVRVVIAFASRDSYVGDAAQLAHRMMDMEDIDAVVLLLEMEGKTTIIARSRAPELDVSELLREFGGGGHATAASATVRAPFPDVTADSVREALLKHVHTGKTAADIMTSPVITTGFDSLVSDAEGLMTRYGVNVLPLLKDGAYSGLISRETVEKALFHGLGSSPCSEFATVEAKTVAPETPIREVESMMIEHNQRFMPVLKGEAISGAITRTDLLRVMYEELLKKRHFDAEDSRERTTPGRNLASWLRERFRSEAFNILKTAGETAEAMGCSAYLVGGSVRDLLMGHENLDLDIVVEGDGIAFARSLASRLDVRIRPHERFGTAHMKLAGMELDIATARTEYYDFPAALPKVEMSSIKKDLYRRDFTINTLAVKLNPSDFGRLIDFFGGQRDIREKTIRVLHNLSYVEDPTRAFRAIRFAERFGFRLSRHTENLIKSAIQMDLFEKLSGHRLYDELVLALRETNPIKTAKRLSQAGLLRVVHRDISFDDKMEAVFESLHETIAWYNLLYREHRVDGPVLYLAALFSRLDAEAREEVLQRLAAPGAAAAVIRDCHVVSPAILHTLPLKEPASIHRLLSDKRLETVLYSMAVTSSEQRKKEISSFLVEFQKVKPMLRGADLKKIGLPEGPVYSEILKRLLDEKLRGSVKTAEDEAAFVRKHYKKFITAKT